MIRLFREFRPPERASSNLTPQETELLRLLVKAYHYKTAADKLGISVNTVSFHLRNIYTKLEVHSKTEAVAKALRDGLVLANTPAPSHPTCLRSYINTTRVATKNASI